MNSSPIPGGAAGPLPAGLNLDDSSANLLHLEKMAETFYSSTDAGERRQAQTALLPFSTSSDCIAQCQFLLNHSKQPYALLLASSSLLKLITQFWNKFSAEQTVDMRNYLLNYLAVNCDKGLPPFVIAALIQVICRISKLGWNDDAKHQDICTEVTKFLEHTAHHCAVGLQILAELVDEMDHCIANQTVSQHRKIAVSFRDKALLNLFQISLTSLKQIQGASGDAVQDKLKGHALNLALKCLLYDYIGTNADEAAEEFGALQIPSSWRSTLEDGSVLSLFMDILAASSPPHTSQCMEIIVQMASCRRSLFTREDLRRNYLQYLCVATTDIINNQSAILSDHDCYTHFCRLLVAMKANYQLQDLVKSEGYPNWIRAVASFTISSFQNWEWAGYSTHYLVTLWSRLTISIPYMRGDLPTFLHSLVPEVSQAYIESRLKAAAKSFQEDDLQSFFEESSLQEHIHYMPTLCRHVYSRTFSFLQARMDPLIQQYKEALELLSSGAAPPTDFVQKLAVVEVQLAWLCYVIAAIVSGHLSTGTSREDQLRIDAQLSARVFSCVDLVSSRMAIQSQQGLCLPYLDLAIIYFFQMFRRNHVGQEGISRGIRVSDSKSEPQIYSLLSEQIGPTDQSSVLSSMLQKIVTDLKVWAQCNRVVVDCLTLLHDLASGYTTSKLLVQLDASKAILRNHGSECFPFLDVPDNSKLRTKFYLTWGRLACTEPNIDYFDALMEPFDRTFQFLQQHTDFRSEQVRKIGIGICRDLRGIVSSTYNKTAFQIFFDWLYPKYFGQILRLLETWWDSPSVCIPILRFTAEFVHNKTQRISFSPSSPNGIILFKEASKVLQIYGERILASTGPVSDVYKERYKSIGICMEILQRALSGDYVNFGVFVLYNDKALSNALQVVVKLILLFPLHELLAFSKISLKYFSLMEILFRNHMPMMTELDTPVFLALVSSMMEGLSAFDVRQSSLAATAIDNVASYLYTEGKRTHSTDAYQRFKAHLAESGDLFPQLLHMILHLILFENVTNHWSLSRPVLSLVLTMEQAFNSYKAELTAAQTPENQVRMNDAFTQLMDGVRPSLENRNRDKFTQNLVLFRNDVRKFAVNPSS